MPILLNISLGLWDTDPTDPATSVGVDPTVQTDYDDFVNNRLIIFSFWYIQIQ